MLFFGLFVIEGFLEVSFIGGKDEFELFFFVKWKMVGDFCGMLLVGGGGGVVG